MTYRTTRQADQDIIDLYVRGVLDFGTAQAERYHQGLMATFDLLAQNPRIARERMEFNSPIRAHPYQSHLIVYVLQDDEIVIVRVLHGRLEWERYL